MKLYILMDETLPEGTICLTKDLAYHKAKRAGSRVITVEFDLRVLVNKYFHLRGYTDPNATQAFLFLVSETGELADKLVHSQAAWVRNHPNEKDDDVASEIGDCQMMLTKFAEKVKVDPIEAMFAKMQRKLGEEGFNG